MRIICIAPQKLLIDPKNYQQNLEGVDETMKELGLVGWWGIPCIAMRHSYIESHELSIVHDMVKRIAKPVIRRKF